MHKWTVSLLAREFKLSRSTLLYYDSIGLLSPVERSKSGYRIYSESMVERLRQICAYRETGMPLREIARLLGHNAKPGTAQKILQNRLDNINKAICSLRVQQRLVLAMLAGGKDHAKASLCDRDTFVETLQKAGLSSEDMRRFHLAFEKTDPAAHYDFLGLLGFSSEEIADMRKRLKLA